MIRGENEWQVFGPPGTGKTTYLSKKIKGAAEKKGGNRLIVSSFTRSAAKELTGRELPVPKDNIGTLHSFCYRLLGNPTVAETKIKEFNEQHRNMALSTECGGKLEESAVDVTAKTEADAAFSSMQIKRAKMIPQDKWAPHEISIYKAWDRWKFMNDYVDFTDMIEMTLKNRMCPQGVDIGIFDEAQDFTPMQLALIRQWSEDSLDYILVAGDDDQAIFTFAGADPHVFINPLVTEDRKTILDRSYRCPKVILNKAQDWIKRIHVRQPKTVSPRLAEDGSEVEGEINRVPLNFKSGDQIAYWTAKRLDQYPEETIMILAACSYMLKDTIDSLKELGIPFGNKYRRRQGNWNPLHPGKGVSAAMRLLSYLKPQGLIIDGLKMWDNTQLHQWVDACEAKGLLKTGGKKKIKDFSSENDYSKDDYNSLIYSCFEHEEIEKAVYLLPSWLKEKILPKKMKAFEYPFKILDKYGVSALSAEPRVIISTIHAVKGAEADNVLVFPDISMNASRAAHNKPEDRDAIIRQFYVGMTRARQRLYIGEPCGHYRVNI